METPNVEQFLTRFRDSLGKAGCLSAEWLHHAVVSVPRHLFIDQYYETMEAEEPVIVDFTRVSYIDLQTIYSDRGLMSRKPPNHSAASQPALVMRMLVALTLEPGMRVLEIGTGSGWNAALMAFRVGNDELVHSIDLQADLVDAARRHLHVAGYSEVRLASGDGGFGWEDRAPFDRIIVTVGSPDIPPAWHQQLADGGVLLVPFKVGAVGDPLLRLRKSSAGLTGSFVGWSGFNTLQGEYWTNIADPLQPPFDAELASLLTKAPKEIATETRANIDFLLFAHLEGVELRSLVDHNSSLSCAPTVYHKESHSTVSLDSECRAIHWRGDSRFAADIAALIDKWASVGTPGLSDYQIDVLQTSKIRDRISGPSKPPMLR